MSVRENINRGLLVFQQTRQRVVSGKAAQRIAFSVHSAHDVGDAEERKGNKGPDGIPEGLHAYRRGRVQLPREARREGERKGQRERGKKERDSGRVPPVSVLLPPPRHTHSLPSCFLHTTDGVTTLN